MSRRTRRTPVLLACDFMALAAAFAATYGVFFSIHHPYFTKGRPVYFLVFAGLTCCLTPLLLFAQRTYSLPVLRHEVMHMCHLVRYFMYASFLLFIVLLFAKHIKWSRPPYLTAWILSFLFLIAVRVALRGLYRALPPPRILYVCARSPLEPPVHYHCLDARDLPVLLTDKAIPAFDEVIVACRLDQQQFLHLLAICETRGSALHVAADVPLPLKHAAHSRVWDGLLFVTDCPFVYPLSRRLLKGLLDCVLVLLHLPLFCLLLLLSCLRRPPLRKGQSSGNSALACFRFNLPGSPKATRSPAWIAGIINVCLGKVHFVGWPWSLPSPFPRVRPGLLSMAAIPGHLLHEGSRRDLDMEFTLYPSLVRDVATVLVYWLHVLFPGRRDYSVDKDET